MAAKKTLRFYKLALLISIVVTIAAVVALVLTNFSDEEREIPLLQIEELSTQGYTKVDVQVSAQENVGVVVLQGGCYQLTATTELSQIKSIINGQEGRISYRPMTHDLFNDALESLDVDVLMVKIVDMQNNTYFGRLILKQDERIVSLDSRPSDGIAVAVRTDAPVYIKDELLKAQGENVC